MLGEHGEAAHQKEIQVRRRRRRIGHASRVSPIRWDGFGTIQL
jgi:hypothetical protein